MANRWTGQRVFGWIAHEQETQPSEVTLIRQAARQVIDGESPGGIAREWNLLAVPTVGGGSWYSTTVENVLRRRSNTVGADPILSAAVREKMLARLNDPGRRVGQPVTHEPLSLGKGLVSKITTCGMCGSTMWWGQKSKHDVTRLVCSRDKTEHIRGERHTTMLAPVADERARAAVIEELAARQHMTITEASEMFSAMSLLKQRRLALDYFTFSVHPHPRGQGSVLKIESRSRP